MSPAETLPLDPNSVKLVTVASAAHWLDFPRFSQEVDRVLKPGGCLAVSNYSAVKIHCSNQVLENQANECVEKFVSNLTAFQNVEK